MDGILRQRDCYLVLSSDPVLDVRRRGEKQHSPSDKVPFLKRIIKFMDTLHNRKAIVLGFHWLALLLIYFALLYCGRAVTYDKGFGDSYIRHLKLSACFKPKANKCSIKY